MFPLSSIQDIRAQHIEKKLYYGMKNFNVVRHLCGMKIEISKLKLVVRLMWLKCAANLVILLGEMPNGPGVEKRKIRGGQAEKFILYHESECIRFV